MRVILNPAGWLYNRGGELAFGKGPSLDDTGPVLTTPARMDFLALVLALSADSRPGAPKCRSAGATEDESKKIKSIFGLSWCLAIGRAKLASIKWEMGLSARKLGLEA